MKSEVAEKLMRGNWNREFVSYDALFNQIETLAYNGAYKVCVTINNPEECKEVKNKLRELGYDIENYAGYADIILISWG